MNHHHPLRLLGLVVLVAGLFAAGGAFGGWLWEHRWTPGTGVAYQHRFVLVGKGPERDFGATGSYLVIGVVIGLLLGLALALVVRRHELLTLALVLVCAGLAGWGMAVLGHRLGPPDPAPLARQAADLTRLRQDLRVQGRSPYVAMPFGALAGLVGGYVLLWVFPRLQRPQPVAVVRLSPDTTR